ncbi:MAG: hypothetical protein ACM335_00055 [Deltaproteobacteria bacterium]
MKKTILIVCITFLAVLLTFGCSPSVAEKKDEKPEGAAATVAKDETQKAAQEAVEKEVKPTEAEAAAAAKEAEEKMKKEKEALEEEVGKLKKEMEDMKMQREREGEKVIPLLDGKIKYTVDQGAVMDYEEIVAITMKSDPAIKESMLKGGKEADLALLDVLQKISPDDRRVTAEETKAYLKAMKQAPAKPAAAPAKAAEQQAVEKKEAAPEKGEPKAEKPASDAPTEMGKESPMTPEKSPEGKTSEPAK